VANGLDMLLDAVDLVPRDDPMAVVVAGDGGALGDVSARLRREGLDRICLLGAVPRARVREILAASDVGLHLLRADALFETALPSKVLEYFGAHRPFITTVRGLPQRLAVQSEGGFAGSAGDLARKMSEWARLDPAERTRRGEAAFRYGIERFGVETTVDGLEALFDTCVLEGRNRDIGASVRLGTNELRPPRNRRLSRSGRLG
jgi:hypothetical protein